MSATTHRRPVRASRVFRLAALAATTALLAAFQPARGEENSPAPLSSPNLALPAAAGKVAIEQTPVATSRKVTFDDGWVMQINPAPASSVQVNGKSYQAVYDAIPYRRSEYLANPSYRHDTTVELLFGQMRPTVIHRTDEPQRIVNPRPSVMRPYLMSRSDLWSVPWWSVPGIGSLLPYTPFPPVLGAIRF